MQVHKEKDELQADHTTEPWSISSKEVLRMLREEEGRPDEMCQMHAAIDVPDDKSADGRHYAAIVLFADDPDVARERAVRICTCVNGCQDVNPKAVPDLLRGCIVAIDWLADKGVDMDHVEAKRIRDAIALAQS